MKINTFFATIACVATSFIAQAQDLSSQSRNYNIDREKPVWIDMMNNPNVNYYEACKAFYSYWEGKELPAESEGETNDLGKKEDEGLHFKDLSSYAMIYEYKRFKNWERVTLNHTDPTTGRILTEQELKTIWQVQTKGINTHIE